MQASSAISAVSLSCSHAHDWILQCLWLCAGLKVNSKTRKGTNALHFAAKKGHVKLVQYLIRRKANVSATDRNGKTALDLASDKAVKAALQAALDGAHDEKVILPLLNVTSHKCGSPAQVFWQVQYCSAQH